MAIDSVTITQDNIVNGSNLLPVHSPLTFIADVAYTGDVPDILYVDVIKDEEVIETFRAIPYKDPLSTVRQFVFVANDVMKGLMGVFDDELQLTETLIYVNNITRGFTLKFYDPDNIETSDSVTVDFIHAATQFGEYPNLTDVFNNEFNTYLCPENSFCYVYFYNDDESNEITIGDASLQNSFALDYEDSVFTDFDDEPFTIDVPI